MALPKRRHSRARSAKRRTNWKLRSPAVHSCAHCHQPKRPHCICTHCGYYDGREIVEPAEG